MPVTFCIATVDKRPGDREAAAAVALKGEGSIARNLVKVTLTSTAAIVAAMITLGIARLIVLSAIPLVSEQHKSLLERELVHPMLYRFFGGGYQDMRRMQTMLDASSIDWTIFRPSRLTDKPKTGTSRIAIDAPLKRAWSISRGDLADAMLQAVSQ